MSIIRFPPRTVPFIAPRFIAPDTLDPAVNKPGPLYRFKIDEEGFAPRIDLAAEQVRDASASFNRWLEERLPEAFNRGKDYAVTRVVDHGDRPKIDANTLSWTTTLRWQGTAITPGTEMGRNWTVYHRPADWTPTEE